MQSVNEVMFGRKLKPEERNLTNTQKAVKASVNHPSLTKKAGRRRRSKRHNTRRSRK